AWTPGTFEAVPAPALLYPATPAEAKALVKKDGKALQGAWLVQPKLPRPLREQIDKLLEPTGIAGIVRSADDGPDKLVHTSGRSEIEWGKLQAHVSIVLRADLHTDLLARVKAGTPVKLAFSIDNRFFRGPVPQHNVVADLRGSERPDEYVI